jgi:hypothetical protein
MGTSWEEKRQNGRRHIIGLPVSRPGVALVIFERSRWWVLYRGIEPMTCRLTEGLSRRGPAGTVRLVGPLHLHKGLSRG